MADSTMIRSAPSGESDEHTPKRRKKERQSGEKNAGPAKLLVSMGVPSVNVKTIPSDRDPFQEAAQEPLTKSVAVSDADWLRSSTSRLLVLVDDDNTEAIIPPENAPTERVMLSEIPQPNIEGSVSDASVQMNGEVEVEGAMIEDEIISNGRLFVRNLTYTITEQDLRKHFEDLSFGTIEEVSPGLHSYPFHLIEIS